MRKLFVIPFLFFSLTTMAACSEQDEPKPETEQPTTPDSPDNGKTLVVYFSAQGHTQAVAERIVELTGADVCRIEAAEPYAVNPYDDSDRIQNEAYNDLRPGVANLRCGNDSAVRYDFHRFALLVAPARYGSVHVSRSIRFEGQGDSSVHHLRCNDLSERVDAEDLQINARFETYSGNIA